MDHKTKCVFNGCHLGKQYSANAIQQRCSNEQAEIPKQQQSKQPLSGYKIEEIHKEKQAHLKYLKTYCS